MNHLILSLLLTLAPSIIFCQPFGNAVLLNGTTDFISVPDHSGLNQTTTLSIEAWVNLCDTTGNRVILSKFWCQNNQNAYSFGIRAGRLEWIWDIDDCSNSAHIYSSSVPLIQPNIWYHVAVVHTTTNITLFINGLPIEGQLTNGSYSYIQSSAEPVRIGSYKKYSEEIDFLFEGMIDELRFWDYNLSADEVESRFDAPLSGNEAGLVAYFNMEAITQSGSNIGVTNIAASTASALNGKTIGTNTTPSFIPSDSVCEGISTNVKEITNNISVFPIPTSDLFTVDLGEVFSEIDLTIYSSTGAIVNMQKFVNSKLLRIHIEEGPGIYFLQLKLNGTEMKTLKIVKQN